VSFYKLVAIIRKRMQIDESLCTILQGLSLTLFEKMTLYQAFAQGLYKTKITILNNKLKLFAF